MLERARYFPRERYTLMPWRNGAGTTREVVREPALGETFAWRLSLATIKESGPFSSYPGYQRAVALVEGHGFRLNTKNTRAQVLNARGEHALFAGSAQTDCELLDGPCTDLSLMVREPGRINTVTRLRIGRKQSLSTASGSMQALFVLHGTIECRALQPSPPGCTPDPHVFTLNLNDTLLIEAAGHSWSVKQASSEIADLLMLSFAPPREIAAATGAAHARADMPADT